MEEKSYNMPVYKVFIKEIKILGLPRNLAITILSCIFLSLLVFNSFVFLIFFSLVYIAIYLLSKLSRKFDPKILEVSVRYCIKKYLNY